MDATQYPAIQDTDRVAMLTISATYKLIIRADSVMNSNGHSSSFVTEHPEPHRNFLRMCSAFLVLGLEWAEDFPDDMWFVPANGSHSLEEWFGTCRTEINSFGLADLLRTQFRKVASQLLVSSGKVVPSTKMKGYSSNSDPEATPECWDQTPRPALVMVMLRAMTATVDFVKKYLLIDVDSLGPGPAVGSSDGTESDSDAASAAQRLMESFFAPDLPNEWEEIEAEAVAAAGTVPGFMGGQPMRDAVFSISF